MSRSTTRLQTVLLLVRRPLLRLVVRRSITFPALCDMLRELYVDVADHDCPLPAADR